MTKIKVVKSESQMGNYRLIIDATDGLTLGAILSRNELIDLVYAVKDLLVLEDSVVSTIQKTSE